jgi:hypothetical protein
MMIGFSQSILSALFGATTANDVLLASLFGRNAQANANLQSEPGFVSRRLSLDGSDTEANVLPADDGLLRLGVDPRITRLRAQGEEQAEHEASIADLQSLAAEASKGQQAREAALDLSMRQARERAEAQMASVGVSEGPRRPMAPQVGPRYGAALARLRGQTRGRFGRQ